MNMHSRLGQAAVLIFAGAVVGARGPAGQTVKPAAVQLTNPVVPTAESIATGKKAYDANCASCHGNLAQGAEKAGVLISIIQEQGGKQPPI